MIFAFYKTSLFTAANHVYRIWWTDEGHFITPHTFSPVTEGLPRTQVKYGGQWSSTVSPALRLSDYIGVVTDVSVKRMLIDFQTQPEEYSCFKK